MYSLITLTPIIVAWITIPKFIYVLILMIIAAVSIRSFLWFQKDGDPLAKWQLRIIKPWNAYISRLMLFAGNVFWIHSEKLKVDYSKYLGPDWKMTYDNPTVIVKNHSCYMDVLTSLYFKNPGFVAKEGVKKWPFVEWIGKGN